jgi:hypothetical protein
VQSKRDQIGASYQQILCGLEDKKKLKVKRAQNEIILAVRGNLSLHYLLQGIRILIVILFFCKIGTSKCEPDLDPRTSA